MLKSSTCWREVSLGFESEPQGTPARVQAKMYGESEESERSGLTSQMPPWVDNLEKPTHHGVCVSPEPRRNSASKRARPASKIKTSFCGARSAFVLEDHVLS